MPSGTPTNRAPPAIISEPLSSGSTPYSPPSERLPPGAHFVPVKKSIGFTERKNENVSPASTVMIPTVTSTVRPAQRSNSATTARSLERARRRAMPGSVVAVATGSA
jgi:hypothetical protein